MDETGLWLDMPGRRLAARTVARDLYEKDQFTVVLSAREDGSKMHYMGGKRKRKDKSLRKLIIIEMQGMPV